MQRHVIPVQPDLNFVKAFSKTISLEKMWELNTPNQYLFGDKCLPGNVGI